ncbi:MAG: hypothetical protein R2770_09205 [Acidimicrobiales bacterium]
MTPGGYMGRCYALAKVLGVPSHLRGFLALAAGYGDWETGEGIRPSQETLADDAGISVRQARRNLDQLVDLGALVLVAPLPSIAPTATASRSRPSTSQPGRTPTSGLNLHPGRTPTSGLRIQTGHR